MGARGPAPTPTAILKARGSWRGDLNPKEMKPKAGAPKPPKDMKGEALAEWKRIVKELSPAKVLTKADRPALTLYCQAWAQREKARTEIDASGAVVEMPNGYPAANPWVKVFQENTRICMKLMSEFGCSPSARARIPSLEKTDENGNKPLEF